MRTAMIAWSHEPGMFTPEGKARSDHFEKHDRGASFEIVSPIAVPFLIGGAIFRKARQHKYDPAATCPLCIARWNAGYTEKAEREARRARFLGE